MNFNLILLNKNCLKFKFKTDMLLYNFIVYVLS